MFVKLGISSPALRLPLLTCAVTFVAALMLGGGTRSGFLTDAILQLICVPMFLIALAGFVTSSGTRPSITAPISPAARLAVWLCAAFAALHLLQLMPLPPAIWTRLPGHEQLRESFDLVGRGVPWMPLSVAPRETWLSLLSLLPPMTILLLTLQVGYIGRRGLVLLLLVFGTASAMLGLLQVAQGPSSALRPFAYTSPTEAVGLFANRNHFAALIYSVLIFTAAWAVDASARLLAQHRNSKIQTSTLFANLACFTIVITLISAQAMARSRAGLALTLLAAIGAVCLPMMRGKGGMRQGFLSSLGGW